MEDKPLEIIVDPDARSLQEKFDDMLSAYQETLEKLRQAFQKTDLSDFLGDTVSLTYYTKKYADQLLYLRLSLGRLKTALQNAFAPIGAVVLPVINKAINQLTRFLHTVQAALSIFMDSATGTDSVAESAKNATKAYKSLGGAVRRSLAGFDQLERLNGASGGTAQTTGTDPVTVVAEDVAKILAFLQPLLEIDLTPLKESFARLWEAVKPITDKLGEAFRWLWHSVLTPFIAWCAEKLFPALNDTFGSALQAAGSALSPLIDGLMLLWNAMQPVVEFIRQAVVVCLQSWQQVFGALATELGDKGPEIATIFHNIGQVIQRIWAVISPILSALYTQFQATFAGLGTVAAQSLGAILEGLAGLTEFVAGIFTGDWNRAWNGILYAMKGFVNSLIGMMNAILTKLTGTLNGMIRLVNNMRFTVPSWVPGIGGESYSFGFKTLTAPQIPYLAKGAVLPANKPFLAVVGDQKHGTNIEAPLSTIQEAVAGVMGTYAADQHAAVEVLEDILQAVLGIEIGDERICNAAARHQAKMAIVRGGAV